MQTDPELAQARALFNIAHLNEADCQQLMSFCAGKSDVLLQAYLAAGKMVYSKFKLNPYIGMKSFNEGKKELEALFENHSGITELHYVRYTIQRNAPRFVGYYRKLEEDGSVILRYLKSNPQSELRDHMMLFLEDTKDPLLKEL